MMISEREFNAVKILVRNLLPIKITVETLCRRDANLLTADAALSFMLKKIQPDEVGETLKHNLITRIKERRNKFWGLLQYLHNGGMNELDDSFTYPSKLERINLINKLVKPTNENQLVSEDADIIDDSVLDEPLAHVENVEMFMAAELQNAIASHLSITHQKPKSIKSFRDLIRKEMDLFEAEGVRGIHLEKAYQALLCIEPTSVESERCFSASGRFCTKIRSRLGDEILSDLTFLRAHFLRERED